MPAASSPIRRQWSCLCLGSDHCTRPSVCKACWWKPSSNFHGNVPAKLKLKSITFGKFLAPEFPGSARLAWHRIRGVETSLRNHKTPHSGINDGPSLTEVNWRLKSLQFLGRSGLISKQWNWMNSTRTQAQRKTWSRLKTSTITIVFSKLETLLLRMHLSYDNHFPLHSCVR